MATSVTKKTHNNKSKNKKGDVMVELDGPLVSLGPPSKKTATSNKIKKGKEKDSELFSLNDRAFLMASIMRAMEKPVEIKNSGPKPILLISFGLFAGLIIGVSIMINLKE